MARQTYDLLDYDGNILDTYASFDAALADYCGRFLFSAAEIVPDHDVST